MRSNTIQNAITKSAQIVGIGALLALFAGGASADLGNGTFETPDATGGNVGGISGWETFGSVFTTANDGPNSAPVSHDQPGNQSVLMSVPSESYSEAGAFQNFAVTPGVFYELSAWVMNWVGDPFQNIGVLQLGFHDGPNGTGESLDYFATVFDTIGTYGINLSAVQDGADVSDWTQIKASGVAPVGAVSASIYLVHTSQAGGGGSLFWDDVSLRAAGINIDIEKLTNGMQADQSNDPDVPRITQGMTVNWIYEVTNTGNSAFPESEILVFDNQLGVDPILDAGSDVGGDMILSPGEKWIYNASAQALDLANSPPWITVVPGCYKGQNTYQNIGWVWVNGGEYYDEDTSHYCNPVDSDNDGLPDNIEDSNNNGIVDAGETDPFNPDSDNDGVLDGQEDTNANGVIDAGEADPLNPDTDGDGLTDGYEINVGGTDPTSTTPLCANPGDMNGDGEVNVGDLLLLQRQIMGL